MMKLGMRDEMGVLMGMNNEKKNFQCSYSSLRMKLSRTWIDGWNYLERG